MILSQTNSFKDMEGALPVDELNEANDGSS